MKRMMLLLFVASLALVCLGAGCCHKESGSRQFIPGKGWVPTE